MISRLDAPTARRWLSAALSALASARSRIDALNVFPVADSDTGTNVVLTLAAGARTAQELDDSATLGELARATADGALWGARGNSGVILAQALQALARTFDGMPSAGPSDLIRAFDAIAQGAHRALAAPVEGTIVTVARDVASASLALSPHASLADVVATAVRAANESLATTTDLLPALRGTGMVDAGALAFTILLEALAGTLGVEEYVHPDWLAAAPSVPAHHGPLEGFEVMYLVQASHRQATALRMHLSEIGNSVVVVQGAHELWHVHVHLDHPAQALSELPMSQVCVRRLDSPDRRVGLVAVTTAPLLLEPLAQAGAVAVLGGNATTIARAVVDAGSTDVVVLPCSTAAAADAAAAGLDPVVRSEGLGVVVAPTHDDLAVYEAVGLLEAAVDGEVADHLATVREHVASTRTHAVPNGDTRALEADVHTLAGELVDAAPSLVSVLAGATVGARRAAKQLTALLRAANPTLETFIVVGGQSEPALLVSAQ
jgi:dihydroxyacetone kinase-like predicted kinase